MKRAIFLCLVVLGTVFAGCHSDDDTWGDWKKAETPFGGVPRVGAVSFTIDKVVYAGLGMDVDNKLLTDFWKRSADGGWYKIETPFPSVANGGRIGASAFVLNGKAYVGLGYQPQLTAGQNKLFLNDFYEFNPVDETWTKIADCTLTPRRDAVAFVLNNIAYVGSGAEESDKVTNDFRSFDGTTWKDAGTAGEKRRGGTAFVIDGFAYVCLGYSSGSALAVDMMRFDGTTWTAMPHKLADISDDDFDDDYNQIPRAYAVSFVSNLMGDPRAYIATGTNGSLTKTCWEYSPKTDRWDEMTSLPARANGRVQGIGYVVDDYGYIALGGSGFDIPQFDDIWIFDPRIEEDDKNDY